jgi:hypothetical protein
MGELFQRYFQLLAGRTPGAEYGVIATPSDEATDETAAVEPAPGCLCPGT